MHFFYCLFFFYKRSCGLSNFPPIWCPVLRRLFFLPSSLASALFSRSYCPTIRLSRRSGFFLSPFCMLIVCLALHLLPVIFCLYFLLLLLFPRSEKIRAGFRAVVSLSRPGGSLCYLSFIRPSLFLAFLFLFMNIFCAHRLPFDLSVLNHD